LIVLFQQQHPFALQQKMNNNLYQHTEESDPVLPLDDLSCCKTNTTTTESSILLVLPSTSDLVDDITEGNESDVDIEIDLPQLQNPYEIQDFLLANVCSIWLFTISFALISICLSNNQNINLVDNLF
jgi:hypothetical protein